MQQQARADSSQADLDASTMGYNAVMGRWERSAPPCDAGLLLSPPRAEGTGEVEGVIVGWGAGLK